MIEKENDIGHPSPRIKDRNLDHGSGLKKRRRMTLPGRPTPRIKDRDQGSGSRIMNQDQGSRIMDQDQGSGLQKCKRRTLRTMHTLIICNILLSKVTFVETVKMSILNF